MAKAKGLTSRNIERQLHSQAHFTHHHHQFCACSSLVAWTGAPIFETVFNWPGLGRATFTAIGLYDTPVIVGSTVVFAYLLVITVFPAGYYLFPG